MSPSGPQRFLFQPFLDFSFKVGKFGALEGGICTSEVGGICTSNPLSCFQTQLNLFYPKYRLRYIPFHCTKRKRERIFITGKRRAAATDFFLLIFSLMQCNQQNVGEALWLQYRVALPKKKCYHSQSPVHQSQICNLHGPEEQQSWMNNWRCAGDKKKK